MRAAVLAINDVVRIEVLLGYRDRDEFEQVADELEGLVLLPLSRPVWDCAADLGFTLKRRGISIPLPDLLIAATAIHYDATLLHADSDYETIAQHSGLRTESHRDHTDA